MVTMAIEGMTIIINNMDITDNKVIGITMTTVVTVAIVTKDKTEDIIPINVLQKFHVCHFD